MLWSFLLPFLTGILSITVFSVGYGWTLGLCVLLFLAMRLLPRRHWAITWLLLLNAFLLGHAYASLRADCDNAFSGVRLASRPTASRYLAYRPSPSPTSTVVRVERMLTSTRLSPAHQALISAMLLGDRDQVSYSQKVAFRRAGASHLLALSGTHLGIFLTLLAFLLLKRTYFTRWRWPMLLLTLALLWFYAFMVGMPKSLQRAIFMSSFFLVARYLFRPAKGRDVLADAVVLMLLFDPLSAFDVGAQLSVAALVGLVFFYPVLADFVPSVPSSNKASRLTSRLNENPSFHLRRKVLSAGRYVLLSLLVSLSAWLTTMPFILFYFHQVQLWQPLVGVFLIPLTSLLLYLTVALLAVCALSLSVLAVHFSSLLDEFMTGYDALLRWCGSLPFACVETSSVSLLQLFVLLLMLFCLYVCLAYRTRRIVLQASFFAVVSLLLFVCLS